MTGLNEVSSRFTKLAQEIGVAEESSLRFNARLLAVHEIASQYYCEKKVELKRIHGEEETPETKLGKEAHELLLKDTVAVRREELWREIASGKPVGVREMRLLGRHKNIIVAGVADAITFFKASPVLLCEHKFSSKPIPFRDHHVQARLYCYLLNLMGFDTSNLRYALVLAPPESREDDKLREISLCILQNPQDKFKVKLQTGVANVYLNNFKMNEAIAELDWAIGFWTKQRSAIPTRMVRKCLACRFREGCESSLARRA